MKQIVLLLGAILLGSQLAFAQQITQMPLFAPEIRRVAVFKNGYAFTYREGAAQTDGGWTSTTRTPIGVLGTFWGYSLSPNVRVAQLRASEGENGETERVSNIADFLLANEGAQIRLATQIYEKEEPKIFTGTYQIIKPERLATATNYQENRALANLNDFSIALSTETGTLVLPASLIQTVEVVGQAKFTKPKKNGLLAIKTEGAKNGQAVNLGVAALERGIRWIPAYRVEVKGASVKEAKLELEAMIVNELADLRSTEVYFVVGVPSFLFQDNLSPLSMNTAFAGVSGYFQSGNSNARRDAYSNAISAQSVYSLPINGRSMSESQVDADIPTSNVEEQTASFSAEQLFLYQTNQLDLKKGERASLRLFSLTVPASEIFEWTISDPPQTEQNYSGYNNNSGNRQPSLQDLASRIWYALKLKNTTEMPWTTAPALSFREWKPLGQNILTFTPIGGENILRVTPATEVTGTHTLEEKERTRQQLRYSGSTYEFDSITIEGTIRLRNVKKQPVEIVLTRNAVGEIVSATDGGAISREGLNLQAVNPNSIVKWNLTLPPGEKEIKYSYKIYVRK